MTQDDLLDMASYDPAGDHNSFKNRARAQQALLESLKETELNPRGPRAAAENRFSAAGVMGGKGHGGPGSTKKQSAATGGGASIGMGVAPETMAAALEQGLVHMCVDESSQCSSTQLVHLGMMVKSDAAKNAGCDEVLITPEATLFDRCRCFNTAFTGASSMDEGFNCCLPKWKLTVGFTMGLCKQAQSLDESCKQSLGMENIFKVGDGQCDSTGAGYNTRACGYDGGDCCRSTCNAKLLPCGQGAPFDCKDPDHAAPKQEGATGGTGGAAESLNDVTLDDDEVIVVPH